MDAQAFSCIHRVATFHDYTLVKGGRKSHAVISFHNQPTQIEHEERMKRVPKSLHVSLIHQKSPVSMFRGHRWRLLRQSTAETMICICIVETKANQAGPFNVMMEITSASMASSSWSPSTPRLFDFSVSLPISWPLSQPTKENLLLPGVKHR